MAISSNLISDFYKPFEYGAALIKCSESVVFKQRLEYELSEFGLMLNHYVVGSPAYLEILGQMEDTDSSFLNLINSGAVCGDEDGLPRISFAGENFTEEVLLPSLFALYILGFIGWVGRSYLIFARRTDCPAQAEIIINLPVALGLAIVAILWPIAAGLEIIDGQFAVADSEIANEVYGQGKL
jgi:photosystem I subunit 3